VKDPHWIYPGDILHLVFVDGQPEVIVERGGVEHLSPQVRTQPLNQAIPAIPYEIVAAFMSKPSIVSAEEFDHLPYIVGLRDRHMVTGSPGDEFYARGVSSANPGSRFTVVHLGVKLKDPDDHAFLGYLAVYGGSAQVVGEGTINRQPTDLTTMKVVDTGREMIEGDKLVDDHLDVPLDFIPHAPATQIDAKILAVVDGVGTIGQYQVVAINRGRRQGLDPGTVLITWQRGDRALDHRGRNPGASSEFSGVFPRHVQLPDERSGTMMVFRTYDRMSYALMLTSDINVRINDPVRNP
jgi:hypothetical protein